MKVAALQREMLTKAQGYKRQWDNYRKAVEAEQGDGAPSATSASNRRGSARTQGTVHFHCTAPTTS